MRTCADCRKYVVGDDGEVSTYPEVIAGERVELPLLREPGEPPPCGACPKIPAGLPKSWEHADEFGDWFWDCRAWFFECRAIGDFGDPDPLMRGVAAAFDAADRRAEADRLVTLFKVAKR